MRPPAATSAVPPHDAPFWNDRFFLALVVASLVCKLGLAVLAAGTEPVLDEKAFLGHAERLTAGTAWDNNFRPPLYVAFLSGVLTTGGSADTARLVQALLATLCLIPVYALGRGIGGRGTARIAAGIVAFDPVLTGFSHLLWSETLYLALLLPGMLLLVSDPAAERSGRWLGAGLLLGLASLARPQLLTFAPLLVVWAAWNRTGNRRWIRGALFLTLGWALVVLPWSARNLHATGAFILVDTNGPYNVAVGADPGARFVDKDDAWNVRWAGLEGEAYVPAAARDPAAAQRAALEQARARVQAEPGAFALKSLWEAAHIFTLDDFIGRHLRNRWYGDAAPGWLTRAWPIVAAPFTAFLLLAGLVGLIAQPSSPYRRLATLAVLHTVLLFGLTYSLSRYTLPLRPLLAVAAAWLVSCAPAARERLAGDRRRALAAGLVGLALLAAWSRDLPLLSDMVGSEGRSHRFQFLR